MLILITGGSGSGKSEFAESMVQRLHTGPYLYIATMVPFDDECHKRIERHRQMRKEKQFDTLERYTDLSGAKVDGYGTVLLECMSNLVANEMYQKDGAGVLCTEQIMKGIRHLCDKCEHLIIVSNEIFSDGMVYDEETVRYQKYLAAINGRIAACADLVVEVVYSIPVVHKGNLEEVMMA